MEYKVLIVEDDPMVAMINEQYVCKNPQFVVAASCSNGQEALEFLEANKVDLIVLDVFMPYMDGGLVSFKAGKTKPDPEAFRLFLEEYGLDAETCVMIDDSATLKRVFWYADNSILVLRADNPDFPDMEVSGSKLETVRILGKAVAFQSDVK